MWTFLDHVQARMRDPDAPLQQPLSPNYPSPPCPPPSAPSLTSHPIRSPLSASSSSLLHPVMLPSLSFLHTSLVEFDGHAHSAHSSHSSADLSPLPSNFIPVHSPSPSISPPNSPYRGLSSPNVFHSNADSWAAYQCHFIGGSIALALAYALVHPLDTIKTNIQASRGKVSTLSAIRAAVFSRATARACLQGFTVSIVGAAPQGGIRFSTYEYTKCKVLKAQAAKASSATPAGQQRSADDESSSSAPDLPFTHPFLTTAFSAMCGDLASSVVKIPREVITQRLQTGQYPSGLSAFQHIVATEGYRGLYAGFPVTACRDIPFMIVMFSVYENIKLHTGGLLHDYWWCSALAGAASGGLAGLATTPVDVVKTRIMTSGLKAMKEAGVERGRVGGVRREGMWEVGRRLVQEGGWGGLMRGAGARSVWWFCVCGVFFPSYEQAKSVLYAAYNHRAHEAPHAHHILSRAAAGA